MATLRTIAGELRHATGELLPNTTVVIVPVVMVAGDGGDVAILGDAIEITSDGDALVEFDLYEGDYIVEYPTSRGKAVRAARVDSEGPWTLGRFLTPTGDYTPFLVQQAAASAAAAQEIADAFGGVENLQDIADAAAASEAQAGVYAVASAVQATASGTQATASALSALQSAASAVDAAESAAEAAASATAAQEIAAAPKFVRLDLPALLSDSVYTYTAAQPGTVVAGNVITTAKEGYSAIVAASGASDHDLTTAGGVKLYARHREHGVLAMMLGAVGDGSTNDGAIFDAAAAKVTGVLLPDGIIYNVGTNLPGKLAYGTGRVRYTNGSAQSAEVGGFQLMTDIVRTNILMTPDIWAEKARGRTQTPGVGDGYYFNTVISSGADLASATGPISRTTVFGHANLQAPIELERVDVFGSGAMRYAGYAQRTTAVGTLALQWIGQDLSRDADAYYHDFWDPLPPTNAAWDAFSLETKNPGIRAKLATFITGAQWATSIEESTQNVGIGRDSLLHKVKGSYDTALGYQALTHSWNSEYCVAVGRMALRDGVLVTRAVGVGNEALANLQEGNGTVGIGPQAGDTVVVSSNSVFIGRQSGRGLASTLSDVLVIQNDAARVPLIFGNFSNGRVAINSTVGAAREFTVFTSNGATELFAADSNSGDTSIRVNGLTVLKARRPGWGEPTGTFTRTTFATGSVTLSQLAERVAALISDLRPTNGHGLIGA